MWIWEHWKHKMMWQFTKHLMLQYINTLTDFLALVMIRAQVLLKHWALCWHWRAECGQGSSGLCAPTMGCARWFKNTARYPKSTDISAALQHFLTGRNLGKLFIYFLVCPFRPPAIPSAAISFHKISWGSMSLSCEQSEKLTADDTEIVFLTNVSWLWEMRC